MIAERDAMRLHAETLFTHDENGDLVSINEPGGGAAPRFFIGVTREGTIRRSDTTSATTSAESCKQSASAF